jgi:hypothetical protein
MNITSLRPLCQDILVGGLNNAVLVDEHAVVIWNLIVESWHIYLRPYSTYNDIHFNVCKY